ncbi:MAG: putative manganese-dependent inorganic diphosphatase [Verrucomicrobia bacterium]|nr:putative manganese-dependent inorganic diphosphatase [Verrucomicrobiota bacterium]
MQTIVIGHRNPDMDSVCSAAAYAALKQIQGDAGAVAARAGELNARITFVFEKFGVQPPILLTDVTPQVRDVMTATPASVRLDAPIARAVSSIEERKLRAVPVVDAAGRCLGLLSAFKVLHHLFPPQPAVESSRIVRASLADIAETFDGEVIAGGCDGTLRNYLLLVAAMKEESFSARLERYVPGEVVVFAGDRDGIQRRAIDRGVRAIVATGGLPFLPEIIEAATRAGVTLLRSRHDTATTVLQARGAVRAESVVDRDFVSFLPETPLELARHRATDLHVPAFPVIDAAGRLVGILSKSDFIKPIPRQLVLVDHNELTQAVAGADKLTISEVIDHHRIGGFRSDSPVHFWNNPVGSTSTIIALLYESAGVPIPAPTAGLLMAGLVSDTLNLTSPTATPTDRAVLGRLERAAGITAAQLSTEIFAVGSPLQTLAPRDAVVADCKEFAESGVRFSAAQIEEIGFKTFYEKQAEIAAALGAYRESRGLYFSVLLITDINTQNSLLLVSGPAEFCQQIDYPSEGENLWRLDGVVSRKKQLLPYLTNRLEAARLAA